MRDTARSSNEILLVTCSISEHASALESALQGLDAPYARFNSDAVDSNEWPQLRFSKDGTKQVVFKDAVGNLRTSTDFSVIWWDEVYPHAQSFERTSFPRWAFLETQKAMEWILGSLKAHYVDLPSRTLEASNKVVQLERASELGLLIPETIISSDYSAVKRFVRRKSIYKPISRPTVESIGNEKIVLANLIATEDIAPDSISCKLSLVQEYVPKKLEVRTYVVGTHVISVEIHSQESNRASIDWRNYDIANTPHYEHKLPERIAEACRRMTDSFGLEFSALDLILTPDDEYVFLELNPQGRWLWLDRLTGVGITSQVAQRLFTLSQRSAS